MTRLQKRATAFINGEKVKGVTVYRVDDRTREVVLPIRRIRSLEGPSEAPEFIDVDWSSHEYEAEFITWENGRNGGSLIYHFSRDSSEARY